MLNKIRILTLTTGVAIILFGGIALAQETTTTDAIQEINLDANISAQDLGVSEPNILPDNPFYFLKNWVRGIQQLLTFDTVKKAELNLRITNEKLLEVRKTSEKTKNSEITKKAAENYQQEVEKLKAQVDKIKDKEDQNGNVGKFLDKFVKQQKLQQQILQKLETQVPASVLEKIKEVKARHLESFKGVMEKIQEKEKEDKSRTCKETEIDNGEDCQTSTSTCNAEEKCLPYTKSSADKKLFCKNDSDCVCGRDKKTKQCSYGNEEYVDNSKEIQCPDFCDGIGGNLKISCVQNKCRQTNMNTCGDGICVASEKCTPSGPMLEDCGKSYCSADCK